MLIVILNFGGIFGEFRAIHTYPEQRVRLENISSVQGNFILCEMLKTKLCGKLRNNNRCKIVSRSHAFAAEY